MIKIGIVGIGHMGGYHASICATLPSAKLVAIADPDPSNLVKVLDEAVIKSSNYEDWIDRVDCVIIAVPTELHYKIAKDCLERSKHVLIEKPLTKTIAQAEELFKIALRKNLSLHVGHVERFNAAVGALKKIIKSPYLIESKRIGPFSQRPAKDSVVLDLMIHDIDIILDVVDSPVKKISAIGSKIKTNLEDIAVVQIDFESGALANITSSRASNIKKRTMSVHQENSFINLDFTTQDIAIHRHTSDSLKIGHNQFEYKHGENVEHLFVYKDNPLKLEIENFINSIITGTNLIDADQDIGALKLALQIEEILRK